MASLAPDALSQATAAIHALYNSPDRDAKAQANEWLQDFQAKPEAWQTSIVLLTNDNIDTEAQVFSSQTLRRKVVDDFHTLDTPHRTSLRDSLVNLIVKHKASPRIIRTQLCLSLAGVALRMLEWANPLAEVSALLGNTDVANFLEFLTVLPEEVNDNRNATMTDEEYMQRSNDLLTVNAPEVLKMLITFMESSGSDSKLQEGVFRCFLSWLRSGDIPTNSLLNNPLVTFSFKALQMPELFDIAVDVVCELIYQTKDLEESMPVIEQIYPNLLPLHQEIRQSLKDENDDNVRGYCKIFVEAGECYLTLVVSHTDHFRGIVEGIAECTAFHDLDVVPMTFRFWYQLAEALRNNETARIKYQDVYDTLVNVMIKHLHYPDDLDTWTAKERDDFKDFRHVMGDVLKDCCVILGSRATLSKAYMLITEAATQPTPKWQAVEAPLMALRSMGSQVDNDENEVLPEIMKLLTQLPDHPKIKYAATLVIARYSSWTDLHPEFIEYQLAFISSGFENEEVVAASALALKLLCRECSSHLLNYLTQLHAFFMQVVSRVKGMDLLEVTEAVAHVIAAVPNTGLAEVFRMFCMPIAQQLAPLAAKPTPPTEAERIQITDYLQQLKQFFETVNPQVAPSEAHPCVPIVQELWPIMDALGDRYGADEDVAKPFAGCLRSIVISYRTHFVPLLPVFMTRLIRLFDQTCLGQYLWVSSRIVREFGESDPQTAVQFVETLSGTMVKILQKYAGNFNQIPDVIEDYFNLVADLMLNCPSQYLQSSLFPTVLNAAVAGFALNEQYSVTAILRYCRIVLDHANELQSNRHPPSSPLSGFSPPSTSASTSTNLLGAIATATSSSTSSPTPSLGATAGSISADVAIIRNQFLEHGNVFVVQLLNGFIYNFPPELNSDVAALVKGLAVFMPAEMMNWYGSAVGSLPDLTAEEQQKAVLDFRAAVAESNWSRVRSLAQDFITVYRRRHVKARGRRN